MARRHLADLVEEDRPLVRQLEAALALGDRAGERALLVPEQLTLEQRLRQRRAVDLDQRPAGEARVAVQHRRDQFLAGAGFAGDQHGRVGARDPPDRLVDLLHRRALADDQLARIALAEPGRQFQHLIAQTLVLEEALDRQQNLVQVERLGDVVVRSELHRLDRGRRAAVAGDDDHWQVNRSSRPSLTQHVEPAQPGHPDVHHDQIRPHRPLARQPGQHLFAALRLFDGVAFIIQALAEDRPHGRVVIGHKNSLWH